MTMFIHFFCLCPLSLAIKLNFNISKVAYCGDRLQQNVSEREASVDELIEGYFHPRYPYQADYGFVGKNKMVYKCTSERLKGN